MSEVLINDIFDEIRDENKRLINEVIKCQQILQLLEDYRKCCLDFNQNCVCIQNKTQFNELEVKYKTVKENIVRNSGLNLSEDNQRVDQKVHKLFAKNKSNSLGQNFRKVLDQNKTQLVYRQTTDQLYHKKSITNNDYSEGHTSEEDSDYNSRVKTKNKKSTKRVRIWENIKRYVCDYPDCDNKYNKKEELLAHVRNNHTFEKPFECEICEKRFPIIKYLKTHMKYHDSNAYKYSCSYCDFKAPFRHSVTTHEATHTVVHKKRNEKVVSEYVSYVTNSESKDMTICDQMVDKSKKVIAKNYLCLWPGCQQRFQKLCEAEAHVSRCHTNAKPYKCEECGKCFSNTKNLKIHMKGHSVGTVFKCVFPDCGKAFPTETRLRQHKNSVHPLELIPCDWPGCEFQTKTTALMKNHRTHHTNDCIIKCDVNGCLKSYRNQTELRNHKKSHSKPYRCHWPGCEHSFSATNALKGHINKHENNREFKCPLIGCNKSYFYKKHLIRHFKESHSSVPM